MLFLFFEKNTLLKWKFGENIRYLYVLDVTTRTYHTVGLLAYVWEFADVKNVIDGIASNLIFGQCIDLVVAQLDGEAPKATRLKEVICGCKIIDSILVCVCEVTTLDHRVVWTMKVNLHVGLRESSNHSKREKKVQRAPLTICLNLRRYFELGFLTFRYTYT